MSSKSNNESYILRAKTRCGFSLKLLSEYLSNQLRFPPFYANPEGIWLRSIDQNQEILIDIAMPQDNFSSFKCSNTLHFIINSTHFYRLLKTIKKKDSVTIFITEKQPLQLGFCIEPNDEKEDKITTYINIVYVQPNEIDLPEGYGKPINITSKRFQKIKTLAIGNKLKIIGTDKRIKLFVNGKNLFSREIILGDDSNSDDEESASTQTYTTSHITQLTKCASNKDENFVQISYHDELPLLIKMRIGNLANMNVYIKSFELMEQIQSDDDNNDNNDNNGDDGTDNNDNENNGDNNSDNNDNNIDNDTNDNSSSETNDDKSNVNITNIKPNTNNKGGKEGKNTKEDKDTKTATKKLHK